MGNIFSTSSSIGFPQYLYRYSHDLKTSSNEDKKSVFFTKLSGLLCHLKSSKHNEDDNIKIIEYICNTNLFTLNAEQEKIILTVFPSLDEDYIDNIITDKICGEIKYLKLGDLEDKFDEVKNIESKYGSYLICDGTKLHFLKEIEINKVYDFNAEKFFKDDNTDINEQLLKYKTKEEKEKLFEDLKKMQYLQINESALEKARKDKEKHINIAEKRKKESIDGKKKKKSRSKRKRRSKRK